MSSNGEGRERDEVGAGLIARARHDRAAFSEIYRHYVRRVYAFCRAHSRTQEEAEDLTTQTFERALCAIDRYEDRTGRFSSWLLRIASNAAIDRGRRSGHEVPVGDEIDTLADAAWVGRDETARWIDDWERAAWIRTHLSTLPVEQQRVVHLRFFEDRSFGDVAVEMDRSEGAVKQLAQRALKALRGRMNEEAADDA